VTATAPTTVPTVVVAPPIARWRGHGVGWWGMVVVIATEATIFLGLLSTYFFLRAAAPQWPPVGIKPPELPVIAVFSVVLIASSVPIFWAEAGIRAGRQDVLRAGLLMSFLMGAAFLGYQGYEYGHLEFRWTDNAYSSIFYATTGLHGLHVLVGLLINLVVQAKAWSGKLSAERHVTMEVFSLYWHFVDAVWIFVFSSLYLSAHLQ
jgi:heme/copper-type cytochrome/quinol oxidase subunit 3